jgi:hypothetical protein
MDRELFKELEYDPFAVGLGEDILDTYQILRKYPEFKVKLNGALDVDKSIRYVLMVYQKGSPLMGYSDIRKRKLEAVQMLDFPSLPGGKIYIEEVNNMMLCKDEVVNDMIIRFLRVQKDKAWEEYKVFEESRAQLLKKMITGEFGKETQKNVIDNLSTIDDRMEDLRVKITNQDDSKDLLGDLYDAINTELMCPTPEEVADAKMSGDIKRFIPNYYYDVYDE